MVNPHSPHYYVICTVSYYVYFGVYHKEMAIMKVSHKMGFRDSQSRDKLWYSATHFILQRETRSYENLSGICSRAVCVVLDKVLSRGHSFAWHSLYQYFFLLNVPHCIWRKNYCGTLGSMNHLESSRIIKCKVWNLVSFHASNIFQPVSFVFCPALFIFPVSFMFGPRLIVRQQEVWIGNYFHPFSNSFCRDFLPSEQLTKHWVCQA